MLEKQIRRPSFTGSQWCYVPQDDPWPSPKSGDVQHLQKKRTKTSAEAFHRYLNSKFYASYPGLDVFVNNLKKKKKKPTPGQHLHGPLSRIFIKWGHCKVTEIEIEAGTYGSFLRLFMRWGQQGNRDRQRGRDVGLTRTPRKMLESNEYWTEICGSVNGLLANILYFVRCLIWRFFARTSSELRPLHSANRFPAKWRHVESKEVMHAVISAVKTSAIYNKHSCAEKSFFRFPKDEATFKKKKIYEVRYHLKPHNFLEKKTTKKKHEANSVPTDHRIQAHLFTIWWLWLDRSALEQYGASCAPLSFIKLTLCQAREVKRISLRFDLGRRSTL